MDTVSLSAEEIKKRWQVPLAIHGYRGVEVDENETETDMIAISANVAFWKLRDRDGLLISAGMVKQEDGAPVPVEEVHPVGLAHEYFEGLSEWMQLNGSPMRTMQTINGRSFFAYKFDNYKLHRLLRMSAQERHVA